MQKYLTLFSVCFLVLPIINIVTLKSDIENDFLTSSNDSINNSIINQVKKQRILENLNNLDGYFTENYGQVGNDSVRFYMQGKGVWFLDDGVVFEIREEISVDSRESRVGSRESEFLFDPMARLEPRETLSFKCVVLKLNFEGADQVIPEGRGLLRHRSNYFYGNDSSKWCTNVPNFQEIIYENLYDNIDLRYYKTVKGLKYDFIVHPGGNPNDIRLRYEGTEGVFLDNSGNIKIDIPFGDIEDSNLFIYQNIENDKKGINGKFRIISLMTYGFDLTDEFNRNEDLIIDPIVYSTYIGGRNDELGYDIELDNKGYAFIVGWTESSNFPNTTGTFDTGFNGNRDVFILKLNPTGSELVYSTYLGGNSTDQGNNLEIDLSGNAYVTGWTSSTDYPNTRNTYDTKYNGGGSDVFVLKLNPTGSKLIYSTFIGGNDGDWGGDIELDINDNVFISGGTRSSDFPNTTGAYDTKYNGGYDVFVLKLNSNGTNLLYSTFVGGKDGNDGAYDITIDSNGNTYVTGETGSTDFPNTTGAFDKRYNGGWVDLFVFKLNSMGSSLLYSTYIGGENDDRGYGIISDSKGNAYITGQTESSDFPNTTGAFDTTFNGTYDGFVLKLNPTGSALLFSTFIGGNNRDDCIDIEKDSNNNIYVAGATKSQDFPTTIDAYDNTYNGKYDAFIIKLNSTDSNLIFSTFVGGSNNDTGYIVIDSAGNIYMTGVTSSFDFPNTTGVFDATYNGGELWCGDVFVFKLNPKSNISFPSILDFKISKSSILRTNTIYLYSNASDIDDLEKDLTPFFEYRDPNKKVWNITFFSNLKCNNSRWEINFSPPKNVVLGLYDFKVIFNDTDMLFTSWFYLNDSLMVLNNIPYVENLFLSSNKAVLGHNISIWINGTDVEDSEENLTIELEFKNSNEQSWNNIYIDNLRYSNFRWYYNFTVPFNSTFGFYDFRVRFSDSDEGLSQWFYSNDSLLIYNENPEVVNIQLTNNFVYRTNSVFFYVNSTDHETPEPMLTSYGQFKSNGKNEWKDSNGEYFNSYNRWEFEFITTKEFVLGLYDFRFRFEDNESASTGWVYLNDSLEVLNNPPIISEDLDDIEIGIESKIIDLTQYEFDIEDSDKDLIWSVNDTKVYDYLESVLIIDPINDILKIVPLLNVSGIVDIELTLTDKDNGSATKSNITIHIDSRITDLIPKVTLLLPIDKGKVNTLTPKLEWSLDYSGDENIIYTIYLDENIEPRIEIKSGILTTSYELEHELEDKKIYYWKVVPSGGVCLSDSFSFTVDLDFKPTHKVNLTTEKDQIIIKQGNSGEINLSVQNVGNIIDSYKIECISDKLQPLISIDKTNVQLALGMISFLKLGIDIPDHFKLGEYFIFVSAISLSDEAVFDEIIIYVKIVDKDFIPNYEVSISVMPESIEIAQGESKNVTLTIINTGKIKDDYYISFESDDFTTADIQLSNNTLSLIEGNKARITIIITVPENMTLSKYEIKFIVNSAMVSNNTFLTINVKEKNSDGKAKDDNTMLIVGIGIIVIIIVILMIIVLFYFYKKKRPVKNDSVFSEVVTDKPLISPISEEAKTESSIGSTPTSQAQPPPQIPQTPKTTQPLDIQNNEMKRNE